MFLRVLACKQNMCYYHNGFRRQIRKTERERERSERKTKNELRKEEERFVCANLQI
jgi:hypothetical protein